MGRRTYEVALTRFNPIGQLGKKVFVASTTLDALQHSGATIIRDGVAEAVASIKAEMGKDVWLMGGSILARSLIDAGLVDRVEVTVIPAMLGGGVPLVPAVQRSLLHLEECRPYPSGIVSLKYSISAGGNLS
jgi:dihydrofolate reductase